MTWRKLIVVVETVEVNSDMEEVDCRGGDH